MRSYRALHLAVLAVLGTGLLAISQSSAANVTTAGPASTQVVKPMAWPRNVDSEIGETGLQGAQLDRYADWLSRDRTASEKLALAAAGTRNTRLLHRRLNQAAPTK